MHIHLGIPFSAFCLKLLSRTLQLVVAKIRAAKLSLTLQVLMAELFITWATQPSNMGTQCSNVSLYLNNIALNHQQRRMCFHCKYQSSVTSFWTTNTGFMAMWILASGLVQHEWVTRRRQLIWSPFILFYLHFRVFALFCSYSGFLHWMYSSWNCPKGQLLVWTFVCLHLALEYYWCAPGTELLV